MPHSRRSILGVLFLTVFLDMVGFSIIFPLLPAMLDHYLALDGPGCIIGRLRDLFGRVTQDEWALAALMGGVLGSLYSVLQFFLAPVWGALSDRVGRRPLLLLTLAGTAGSYLLWVFAGRFWVLLLARMLGGAMAGNISIASAAVADTHPGAQRAKGMGVLGAGIGLGFVVGPALGGLAAGWSRSLDWSALGPGLNPFSGCAALALLLSLVNLAWAARRFPETNTNREALPPAPHIKRHPLRSLRAIDRPGVRRASGSYFLYQIAFAAMEFTLVFLAVERLGYSERQNAWMFVFVGLLMVAVQGGAIRHLVPRLGERRLGLAGMALTPPGLLLVGAAGSSLTLYLGLTLLALGSALVMPCYSSLVSRYCPEERQGLALGIFRSLGSAARAVGPLLGGILYWRFGSWGPYYVGAVVILVPLALSLGLPPVPGEAAPRKSSY